MLIEITKQQQNALIEIINKATIQGQFAEVIMGLKKSILTEVKNEKELPKNNKPWGNA